MYAARDKACYVCHIHKQHRTDFVRDRPEAGKIYKSGICACACDYELRPGLLGKPLDFVIVYRFGLPVYTVANYVVEAAREIDGVSMGEMPSVVKLHRKDRIAGIDGSEEDGLVGTRTGMGLDICMVCPEEFACPFYRDLLYLFHKFAATVILFVGISFRIFIGKDGALYFQQRTRDEVF